MCIVFLLLLCYFLIIGTGSVEFIVDHDFRFVKGIRHIL